VSQAAVSADLLETLEVLADLAVEGVGHDLRVLAVLDVLLSIEEPVWDLVLGGFDMIVITFSTSSSVNSPARLLVSTLAFLQTTCA